jgi:hypothetical protein
MEAVAAVVTALISCSLWGRFDEAMILGGLAALVGLLSGRLVTYGLVLSATSLALAQVAASSTEWALVIPAILVVLCRAGSSPPTRKNTWTRGLWLIPLAAGIAALRSPDRDIAVACLAIAASLAPIPQRSVPALPKRRVFYERGIGLLLLGLLSLSFPIQRWLPIDTGKTALVEAGEWGKPTPAINPDASFDISTIYSYSELTTLLGAKVVQVDELDSSFKEAWLITPTRPLPPRQRADIMSWVEGGGTLVIVTDHTDLYGHGTVTNSLISAARLHTSLTTLFPTHPSDEAQLTLGTPLALRTANAQRGLGLWPMVTARWYEEDLDYSARNFFGPLRATEEDQRGRALVAGKKAVGKGTIVLFGDSTSFANMAIYQPGVINLIERLRTPALFPSLLLVLWLFLLLGWLRAVTAGRPEALALAPLLGLWCLADGQTSSVEWPKHMYWSGDADTVSENVHPPSRRLSTAFAIVPWSGVRPRWTEEPTSDQSGFWVGEEPPPHNTWRWIRTATSEEPVVVANDSLKPLQDLILPRPPRVWPTTADYGAIKVGGIWSDEAIGSWWFDRGVSHSKATRLKAWLAWLSKSPAPAVLPPMDVLEAPPVTHYLKRGKADAKELAIPPLKCGDAPQSYLGGGITVECATMEGEQVWMGSPPFTEGLTQSEHWLLRRSHD